MINVFSKKIKDNYGSKHGLKNQWKYSVLSRMGGFDRYKQVNIQDIRRLVFICAGNICRSPLAEAVARHAGIATESFGLNCRGGDKADPRAIAYATTKGFNLNLHITRNIKEYVAQPGDLLLGMEPCHAKALEERLGPETMISLIGLWLPSSRAYIHDPYSANEEFFSRCEDQVVDATLALAAKLRS